MGRGSGQSESGGALRQSPSDIYHVSPRSNRFSIVSRGLESGWDRNGIYGFLDLDEARQYAESVADDGQMRDVWKVTSLDCQPEAAETMPSAVFSCPEVTDLELVAEYDPSEPFDPWS